MNLLLVDPAARRIEHAAQYGYDAGPAVAAFDEARARQEQVRRKRAALLRQSGAIRC